MANHENTCVNEEDEEMERRLNKYLKRVSVTKQVDYSGYKPEGGGGGDKVLSDKQKLEILKRIESTARACGGLEEEGPYEIDGDYARTNPEDLKKVAEDMKHIQEMFQNLMCYSSLNELPPDMQRAYEQSRKDRQLEDWLAGFLSNLHSQNKPV